MDFSNIHHILRDLFYKMLPLCGELIGIAKAIACLGALFYIAYRVWQSLAKAEPIDTFPLLRPIAIGICIIFFHSLVLGSLNGIMSPIVTGCHLILEKQIVNVSAKKELRDRLEREAYLRDPGMAYLIDDDVWDQELESLGALSKKRMNMYWEKGIYMAKKLFQDGFKWFMELVYAAVALTLDVLRTFILIVLAILGPIVFAFSVWDGFQSSLVQWLSRYISVYLWLPVSDIFSAIMAKLHELIIDNEIQQFSETDYVPDGSSGMYIILMIIGVIGYFTIPTITSWIIQPGGGSNYNRLVNSLGMKLAMLTAITSGKGASKTGRGLVAGGKKLGKGTIAGAKSLGRGIRSVFRDFNKG